MGCGNSKTKNELNNTTQQDSHHIFSPNKSEIVFVEQQELKVKSDPIVKKEKVSRSNSENKMQVDNKNQGSENKSLTEASQKDEDHLTEPIIREESNNIDNIPLEDENLLTDEIVVILIGNKQAGKTSIFNRLVYKTYEDDYNITQHTLSIIKEVSIDNNLLKKFKFIDTPGLPADDETLDLLKQSHIVLMVYDVSGKIKLI
jgi:hypothetical protein